MAIVAWLVPPPVIDYFEIGADADLNTHLTSVGNYAWIKAGSGVINDVSATGMATDGDTVNKPLYRVDYAPSTANYSVHCDVGYPNNSDSVDVSIGGRYDGGLPGAVNAYSITWLPNIPLLLLMRHVAGVNTTMAQIGQSGTSHHLRLSMNGTSISGYSDGVLIGAVSNSAVAGPGYCAIGSGFRGLRFGSSGANHATYDNLQLTIP